MSVIDAGAGLSGESATEGSEYRYADHCERTDPDKVSVNNSLIICKEGCSHVCVALHSGNVGLPRHSVIFVNEACFHS